jgi:hypothetical protein
VKYIQAQLLFAALILGAGCLPATAVEATLSPASVSEAVAAGKAMAAQDSGYAVAPYLLFSLPDAAHITDEAAVVEAVQLGTPFERLRWEAYREQAMRIPFNTGDVASYDAQHAGRVDFIVYAHSRTEKDRTFLDRFAGGALVRADGTTVATAVTSHTIPSIDTYTIPAGVVNRFLGSVTYRFTLDGAAVTPDALAAPLTFTFTDDGGAVHRIPVTLTGYR